MVKYAFDNLLGKFVFDNNFHILPSSALVRDAQPVPEKHLQRVLNHFRDQRYFSDFHRKNIVLSRKQMQGSVDDDTLILQAINALDEVDKVINMLSKRLREWFAWHCPELPRSIDDDIKLAEIINTVPKDQILKKLRIAESMGATLRDRDLEPIERLAREIQSLDAVAESQKAYIKALMEKRCPNITALTGPYLGAKMLEQAGSLKRLANFPSSTVQLLGAEKALFRHLKTGAKSPRYGLLHEHPLIAKNRQHLHGKIARALADKIAIAAKVDHFKGAFIGNKLRSALEKRFGGSL